MVVSGKVIKIQVTTYDNAKGMWASNAINGDIVLVTRISGWCSGRVVYIEDESSINPFGGSS